MTEAAGGLRVDFYVVDGVSDAGRLRVACRITEKAYLAGQRVLVVCPDAERLRELDQLLWTFADGSFVPHEIVDASATVDDLPVMLCDGPPPAVALDVIVNLGESVPPALERTARVAEIIDGDERRRSAGRTRFRAYRERGVEPHTHNLRAE